MDAVLGVLLALAVLVCVVAGSTVDWRRYRRWFGFWVAGDLPRAVHCLHCGHILTAWCVGCRERAKAGYKP